MKRLLVITAAAALVLTGCGSSGSTTAGSATPTGSSGGSTAASATPTASLSCDELKVEAAHLTTYVHYVTLDVGTDSDPGSYLDEIRSTVATLRDGLGTCSPTAVSALEDFSTQVEAMASAYQTGSAASAVAADKAAIAPVLTAGAALWKALGLNPSVWETVPRYSV